MPPFLRRALAWVLVLFMVCPGVIVAFPQDPLDVDIELYHDAAWNNINQYVYHKGMSPITIDRGRGGEGKNCDPGALTLVLNNRDGRFSPRNPNSPLFGKIGRNTPIRVTVTYDSVTYTRFVGEVVAWPSRWDVSQKDIWVPVVAAGILRRLGQQQKPIRSPLYRAIAGVAPGDYTPHEYWPGEDSANATQIASAISGRPAVVPGGTASYGVDGPVGSEPLLAADAGFVAAFPVSEYADADQWGISLTVNVPVEPAATTTLMRVPVIGGTTAEFRLEIVPGSPAAVVWRGYDSSGASILNQTVQQDLDGVSNPSEDAFFGSWMMINVGSNQDGANTFAKLGVADGSDQFDSTNGTGMAGTTGRITQFTILVDSNLDGIGLGHFAVFTDENFAISFLMTTNALALGGWSGDQTTERFERLCVQEQIPYAITGTSSALMGPERTGTRLQSLRDCTDVDQGVLFERRDELGLKFRTNSSRYNQTPIALDYDVGHISAPFDPMPDDQNVANDREVKRRNGSQARRELTSGPLSIQDPPEGVGRYDDSITLDTYTDDQLEHIASWRLHIGTWDAERYPRVKVDLAVPGNASIIAAIAGADTGDLITIDNLPAWLPPEQAELIVEGYREQIGFYTWDLQFNTSPAGPYNVVGRWNLMAQELHAAINSSVTTADIATTAGPLITTSPGGDGFTAVIDGEHVQVTAVTTGSIAFGTAGTVTHANNASVAPGIPASVATGDLLLVLAAIRNSGTGIPDTPAGYTRLGVFASTDNVQLFAKVATSGAEAAPTITFTGGVAGADTSAQMIRLTGKWHSTSNILMDSNTQLNASAQNINYPGLLVPLANSCIILYLAWKQDDWTSVTSPGTEIGEPDTTTGDDQGIVWSYAVQSTAAAVGPGTFTVTGGGAAISRSAILALRCNYQTATITRGVNGASASHSAGAAVTLARPSRWAL